MGRPLYTNNAATYLAFGITNTATTMQVSANAGSLFPNPTGGDYFYVSLISLSGPIIEIVKCTARSGDILTIERGQEGTSALYWNMGDNVQLRITAAGMNYIAGSTASTTLEQSFTATQGQTVFTLTNFDYAPGTNNLAVFVNGSKQVSGTNYTETNVNTVTFTTGLNVGDVVEFLSNLSVAAGTIYATDINYNEGATGAVTRTLESKLQESVSVKDFGAVGDFNLNTNTGTDDTAAIQAAINYCSANQTKLIQIGLSKITSPLVWPTSQIEIVGSGATETYDSGWVYRGTGTMVTGNGQNVTLGFTNLRDMAFVGPGINSGVNGFYGDFYEGGANGCIFTQWNTAVSTFGSLATFSDNRFIANTNGLIVTNWPSSTTQPSQATTTFISQRNDYYGNTGYGLKVDTTGTGSGNIVSSGSIDDTFEQNNVGFYLNKSFDFLIERAHFEFSTTYAYQIIDSAPTVVNWYINSSDAAKQSITWPGASANQAGYVNINNSTVSARQIQLTTQGINVASFSATDGGGVEFAGAGVVGTWTPQIGATNGTTAGNTYSLQQGNYTRLGNLIIATFNVHLSAKDSGMSGYITIHDLPFAVSTGLSQSYGNSLTYSGVTVSGGSFTQINCDAISNTYNAQPVKVGSGLSPTYISPSEISSTASFSGTIIYIAQPL